MAAAKLALVILVAAAVACTGNSQSQVQLCDYEFVASTFNENWAGTDSDLTFTVFSTEVVGGVAMKTLQSAAGSRFDVGSKTKFTIQGGPCVKPCGLRLEVHKTWWLEIGSDWKCRSVDLLVKRNGAVQWHFYLIFNQWVTDGSPVEYKPAQCPIL